LQEQFAPQNLLLAKHSQYNFRHLDLLQLHAFELVSYTTLSDSGIFYGSLLS